MSVEASSLSLAMLHIMQPERNLSKACLEPEQDSRNPLEQTSCFSGITTDHTKSQNRNKTSESSLHRDPWCTTSDPRIRTQASWLPCAPLDSLLTTTQAISDLLRKFNITFRRLVRLTKLLEPLLRCRLVACVRGTSSVVLIWQEMCVVCFLGGWFVLL